MSVSSQRRFSPTRPCPICGGHPRLQRGNNERCYGFLSEDEQWAHCTREEHAGGLERNPESGTYPHKLMGHCRCGTRHGAGPSDANGHAPRRGKKIVKTYDYRSATGNLLFQVVRYTPKDFAQRRPDGAGGHTWDLDGTQRVLYRLPELVAAGPGAQVFLPEGEEDADLLARLGLLATTNPAGAKKWRDEYTAALRGLHVVILSDNDEQGRKHAEMVARALYGEAASVKVVALPGLPEKGDVSDWLDAGNTVEQLMKIVEETGAWEPSSGGADAPDRVDDVGVLLSDVTVESVEWLWEGRIPLGKLTVIDGDPGTGKSALTIDLAARVSSGREMPTPKEDNER